MSKPRRIRVIGQPRKEPDLKALARAVIELARMLDEESALDAGSNEEAEQ